jgi:hypothetical protein
MRGFIYILIGLLLIANTVVGVEVSKAWVTVKEENPSGTAYRGPHYYTTTIYAELDNGVVLRHVIRLTDNYGTTEPAPTALISYTTPDGKQTIVFEQINSQTIPQVSLPYTADIPIGTILTIKMNDNYNDNNYADGLWKITITKTGILASYATEGGGFFHNTSLRIYNDKTGELLWEIPFPYKPSGKNINSGYWYNFTLPYTGDDATIYDGYRKTTNAYPPTEDFEKVIKANLKTPVSLAVVAIFLFLMGFAVLTIPLKKLRKK